MKTTNILSTSFIICSLFVDVSLALHIPRPEVEVIDFKTREISGQERNEIVSLRTSTSNTEEKLVDTTSKKHFSDFVHKMTGVNLAHSLLDLSGKGVKVGIIDTGVDYHHPVFGDCSAGIGSSNCRIKYGYDFVGDDFTGSGSEPYPDNDPLDQCNGHGTHVAGIVMGNDTQILGVAPDVELGVYRIFGCNGGTTSSILISALEKAYNDGMDIVNLSIGNDAGFAKSPEARMVDTLVSKGMMVIVAIGNDGQGKLWRAENPSVSSSAIAVASVDSSCGIKRHMNFTTTNETRRITFSYSGFPYIPPNPQEAHMPIAYQLTDNATEALPFDGCKKFDNNLSGRWALVGRGNCTVTEKALNVKRANGTHIILFNNKPGDIGPLAPVGNVQIITISQKDGKWLVNAYQRATATSGEYLLPAFSNEDEYIDLPTGGGISPFSTIGLAPDLQVKPDIGAPGGLIYSAFPLKYGKYAVMNGTSMAAPYVSGSYALMLEYYRKRMSGMPQRDPSFPAMFRDKFTNFASAIDRINSTDDSSLPVPMQGAGLIQVYKAIMSTSMASPAKIALGHVTGNTTFEFTVYNMGSRKKYYSVSYARAESLDITRPEKVNFLRSMIRIEFENITTPGRYERRIGFDLESGESRRIQVRLSPNTTADATILQFVSGFIEVTPRSYTPENHLEKLTFDNLFSVPVSGMQGSLDLLKIFDDSKSDKRGARVLYSKDRLMEKYPEPVTRKDKITVNNFNPLRDLMIVQWTQYTPFASTRLEIYDEKETLLGTMFESQLILPKFDEENNFSTKQIGWNTSYIDKTTGKVTGVRPGVYKVVGVYKLVDFVNLRQQENTWDLQTIEFRWDSKEIRSLYETSLGMTPSVNTSSINTYSVNNDVARD